MRDRRLSLDGAWEFLHVPDDRVPEPIRVRTIKVPGPWQAQFADLRMRAGTGLYRRDVEIPAEWLAERVVLRFGAVFHNTRVFVNGALVGIHQGGWLPFAFDITDRLVPGSNEIKIRVESPTDDPAVYPDAPLAEIPFGKQSWYGPLSGIWQSVVLECRSADRIERVRISCDLATGDIRARIALARLASEPADLVSVVTDPSGREVARVSVALGRGASDASIAMHVRDVAPWSPDAPDLYTLTTTLHRDGVVLDGCVERFGFRTIERRDGRLFLNGEPLYLRAALDQDYYPDTICTVPSVEFLEDQFRKAKELGLNCLRCHIKAADPRYYDAADRLGLLIWTELPNGGLSTERSRARKEELLKGIVDRDGNHPSIVIWTIINENWGVDIVNDAEHRAWLKRTYRWLKDYDPTRLVVDNSPLSPSFHVETDLADYHFYAAIPDNRAAWDRFVRELAGRADWLFSPEGDAVTSGDEPLLCSEFGNWGLPYPDDLDDAEGREPWWFETGHDWGDGIMYAHGVENRFADWSLDRVFGDLRRFVEAAQWQQFRALKYEIEAMRREPALAGYVITEFTDCHWESNGLLDMRRNRRVFHDVFKTVNADTVIVPHWTRLSYWAGEAVRIGLALAHGAGPAIDGAALEVAFGAEIHRVAAPRLEPGTVTALDAPEIVAPDIGAPEMARMRLVLRSRDGAVLAENTLDIALHPERSASPAAGQLLWSPDADLRARLARLGYDLADGLETSTVVVAARHDDAIARHVRNGGRLLLLPEAPGSLYPFFPHWQAVRVQAREGTPWSGDWASSFAWLRRSGPFGRVPGGPLVDATMDRVIPTHVICGANLLDFQARVHAGLVVGWIHKPVALAIERAYGKGRIVASTFRLFRDAAGADPTATVLLDQLVRVAASLGRERAEPADAVPEPAAAAAAAA